MLQWQISDQQSSAVGNSCRGLEDRGGFLPDTKISTCLYISLYVTSLESVAIWLRRVYLMEERFRFIKRRSYMRVYRTLIFCGGIPMIIDLWTFHREYSLSFTIFSNSLPCNLQESSRQVNAIDAVLCLRGASVRYKSRDISYAVLVMAECRSKPKCLDSLISKCWGCLLRKSKLDASSMSRSSPIMVRDCASNICLCQWILVRNWATYWIVRRESIGSGWYFDVVCRAENIARLFESVFNFASSEKCCSGSLLKSKSEHAWNINHWLTRLTTKLYSLSAWESRNLW